MADPSVDRRALTEDLDIIVSPATDENGSDKDGLLNVAAENKSDKIILRIGVSFDCTNLEPTPLPSTKVVEQKGGAAATSATMEVVLAPKTTTPFATLSVVQKSESFSYKYSCTINRSFPSEAQIKERGGGDSACKIELPPDAPPPPPDTTETVRQPLSEGGLAAYIHNRPSGYTLHVHNPDTTAPYWVLLDFAGSRNLKLEVLGPAKRDKNPKREDSTEALSLEVPPGATVEAASLEADPPDSTLISLKYACATRRIAPPSQEPGVPEGTITTEDQSLIEGDVLLSRLHTRQGKTADGGNSYFVQLENKTVAATFQVMIDFRRSENIKVVPVGSSAELVPGYSMKLKVIASPKQVVDCASLEPVDPSKGSTSIRSSYSVEELKSKGRKK